MHGLDSPQKKNRVGMRTDGFDVKSRMGSQNSIVHGGTSGRGSERGELTYVHTCSCAQDRGWRCTPFFIFLHLAF